ncbi:MAG: hypothetical protein LBV17_08345 [Treponema sp.]|jgi:hypothetical protein|nr:hypothetical protein [Treponema sp.]
MRVKEVIEKEICKLKYLIILSLLIFCGFNSCIQEDIRLSDFSWDTDIDQIIRKLGKPKETENANGIIFNTYRTKYYSYDADVIFIFMDNKLVGGSYDINSSSQIKSEKNDRNYYISVYNNIKNNLIKEYGNPIDSKDIPVLDMGNERGKDALLKMEMPIYSVWHSNDTVITLVFKYEGYWQIMHSIFTEKFLESQN